METFSIEKMKWQREGMRKYFQELIRQQFGERECCVVVKRQWVQSDLEIMEQWHRLEVLHGMFFIFGLERNPKLGAVNGKRVGEDNALLHQFIDVFSLAGDKRNEFLTDDEREINIHHEGLKFSFQIDRIEYKYTENTDFFKLFHSDGNAAIGKMKRQENLPFLTQ